jgi:hypothetical protein
MCTTVWCDIAAKETMYSNESEHVQHKFEASIYAVYCSASSRD